MEASSKRGSQQPGSPGLAASQRMPQDSSKKKSVKKSKKKGVRNSFAPQNIEHSGNTTPIPSSTKLQDKQSSKNPQEKIGSAKVELHQLERRPLVPGEEPMKTFGEVDFDGVEEEDGTIDEDCALNFREEINKKHSYHNPLTKNKGSISNSKLHSHHEMMKVKSLKFDKHKTNSARLACSQEPILEKDDDEEDHQSHMNPMKPMIYPPMSHADQTDEWKALQGHSGVGSLGPDVEVGAGGAGVLVPIMEPEPEIEPQVEETKYVLQVNSFSQLTLKPLCISSSSSDSEDHQSKLDNIEADSDTTGPLDKLDCVQEMTKLLKIEQVFFKRLPSLAHNPSLQLEYHRIETAEFPLKLLSHALIEETKEGAQQTSLEQLMQQKPNLGTPRFPTDEEIEVEERRLLLSFAFKDQDEIEKYRKEMNYIICQEFIVEKPPESRYRDLRHQLRRFEPSTKKTLVFCGIDALFMFSTQAQIVKTCDRQVKIRKDGIKRRYKIFFRPHLTTFLKTLKEYFELILYLSEEERVASQWVHVLNSFNNEKDSKNQGKTVSPSNNADKGSKYNKMTLKRKQTFSEKFFDIILAREHCIIDKQMKVACRNKEIFLEGRSIKNILFIGTDLKDSMLVHLNAIIVRPYHGNKYENTLAKLKIYLLKYILECPDVREVIRRDFLYHLKAPQQAALAQSGTAKPAITSSPAPQQQQSVSPQLQSKERKGSTQIKSGVEPRSTTPAKRLNQ